MSLVELFLVAVGLSMDAFAVSICKGLSMPKMNWKHAIIVGLYFGGFQALMPFLGYILGSQFKNLIASFDHWVAFFLLVLIGFNMIRESMNREEEYADASVGFKTMTVLAVATSIDALAVGITLSFLQVSILSSVFFIGTITFLISIAGVKVGNVFGCKYKSKAELTGGLILVLIGIKILLDHLM